MSRSQNSSPRQRVSRLLAEQSLCRDSPLYMSLVRQLNKKGRKRKGAVQNLRRQLLSAPLPHSACPSRTPSHPVTNSARNSGLCFTALPEPTLKPLDQLHFHHQLEKTHGTQQSTNSSRLIHTFHHSAACAISTAQDYHPNVWSNSSSGIGSAPKSAACIHGACIDSPSKSAVWSNYG